VFTLVEILVVVAIIGLLAALALPVLRSVNRTSSATKALSNFKQIATANTLYATDNDGQLLGWGRYNIWNDDVFLMKNLNLYLNGVNVPGTSDAALNQIGASLAPFVDPPVPKANVKYTKYFPFTWSINSIFNRANGRFYQNGDPWSGVLNPRRLVEFDKPANTIFAVSGGFEFNTVKAADAALLTTTAPRPSIFYLYGKNDTTPAIFLDGHAEMIPFQIPANKIKPEVTKQMQLPCGPMAKSTFTGASSKAGAARAIVSFSGTCFTSANSMFGRKLHGAKPIGSITARWRDLLGCDFSIADQHRLYECHDKIPAHKRTLFDHLTQR